MNTAYKHLDAKLRIAELTLWQWVGVIIGLAAGVAWGLYISPLGSTFTTITAVYMAALPAAAAVFARLTEFDPWLVIRSAVAWRRRDGQFVAGPGPSPAGYVVTEELEATENRSHDTPELDLASLWKED